MGALQVGRRSMIVCAAPGRCRRLDRLHAAGAGHKMVALDYGNGTAYAGLQMLEGAMPREAVTTLRRHAQFRRPARRADARRVRGHGAAGAVDHAWPRRPGCRLVSTTFFHGTWVADPSVSPEAYAAFVRAVTRRRPAHQCRQAPLRVLLHPRLPRPPRGAGAHARTTSTSAASSSRSPAPFPSTRRAGRGNGWRAGA